jgi:hypothetical protein
LNSNQSGASAPVFVRVAGSRRPPHTMTELPV